MNAETQALRHELDAALADLEEAGTLKEINQTLSDMLDVLKERKGAAPVVNVSVSPTPIQNVVNVQASGHKVHVEYDSMNRVIGMTITPIKKGA